MDAGRGGCRRSGLGRMEAPGAEASRLSAVSARIEAPKAPRGLERGEEVSPSPPGERSLVSGLCRHRPLTIKYFDF